jgi:hypothetical protein
LNDAVVNNPLVSPPPPPLPNPEAAAEADINVGEMYDAVVAKELVKANELLTALEEETANEALAILLEPNGPNTFDAVIKEAEVAFVAFVAVPVKFPVIPPVTSNDPVISTIES